MSLLITYKVLRALKENTAFQKALDEQLKSGGDKEKKEEDMVNGKNYERIWAQIWTTLKKRTTYCAGW